MFGQFFRQLGSRRQWLDGAVRQVAELATPTVCRLASGRVEGMSVCETRGYLRARAGAEIRRQARAIVARVPAADPSWQAALVARAAERVVALAMRQLTTTAWRAPAALAPAPLRLAA